MCLRPYESARAGWMNARKYLTRPPSLVVPRRRSVDASSAGLGRHARPLTRRRRAPAFCPFPCPPFALPCLALRPCPLLLAFRPPNRRRATQSAEGRTSARVSSDVGANAGCCSHQTRASKSLPKGRPRRRRTARATSVSAGPALSNRTAPHCAHRACTVRDGIACTSCMGGVSPPSRSASERASKWAARPNLDADPARGGCRARLWSHRRASLMPVFPPPHAPFDRRLIKCVESDRSKARSAGWSATTTTTRRA